MIDEALPRVVLREPADAVSGSLRSLQVLALKHPVAFQAGFASLVEEGRRFAGTPAGAEWREQLEHSSLLHRARLALELGTLWMLEDEPAGSIPSGFLDALFLAADGSDLESIVDDLFEEMVGDHKS